jgi:hypothetical protein
LSVVRADIIGLEDTIDAGQLRLRSRHGPEAVTMPSNVRWVDTNHGSTFVGLHFANALEPGTFLDSFLDADDEII